MNFPARCSWILPVALLGTWCAGLAQAAAPGAGQDDYLYVTQAGDTLIGLGRRLLVEPSRWREVQGRNAIRYPTRMPAGTSLYIPRSWLRQEVESATVVSVSGDVSHDGGTVKAGDFLAQGAKLSTRKNSFLTLKLADGSLITLDPDGSMTLERLVHYPPTGQRDTLIQLQSGRIETRVQPQGKAGRFQIRTPVAVSAVRGTEFRRSADAGNTDRTEVTEGMVAVRGLSTGGSVEVPRNFGTVSDAGGPHPPVKLLPPPDLNTVPHSWESPQAVLDFAPVPGAMSYTAQAATDAGFQHILAEAHAQQPPLDFGALPDGAYWLRARSTDALGLSGPDAAVAVQRRRRIEAPVPRIGSTGQLQTGPSATLSWSPVAGASGYQVQWVQGADPATSAAAEVHEVRTASSEPLKVPLAPGRYGWRVAALDAAGQPGLWSGTGFLTQKPDAPGIGRILASRRQLLIRWQDQPGRQFRVQLARDPGFGHIVAEEVVSGSQADFTPPRAGGYLARLQAIDADGYASPWSPARHFEIPPPWWVFVAPLLLGLPFL